MKLISLLFCFLFLFSSTISMAEEEIALRGEVYYGKASWYGRKFQGKRTSSGEKFNKNKLTAAHNFLPFNTKVKVTNLKNNKYVVVRINDRGPFKGQRIIDLSEKAAKTLDARNDGIIDVRLQILEKGNVQKIADNS